MAHILVFSDTDFPTTDSAVVQTQTLAAALTPWSNVVWAEADALPTALAVQPALFITPYGSAFPKAAWPAFLEFLRRGGNWLNLGGAPVTRPVRRAGNGWLLEVPQTAYGKELMLRHTFEIPLPTDVALTAPEPTAKLPGVAEIAGALRDQPPTRAWALQVMLTHSTKLFPDECGSSGPRDAVLQPLVQAHAADGRTLVAPVVALAHASGPFAGGRWVLACCDGTGLFTPALITALAQHALAPLVQLHPKPGFACYATGKTPTAAVRVASACELTLDVTVTITHTTDGNQVFSRRQSCNCGAAGTDAWVSTGPLAGLKPGLYRIQAEAESAGSVVATAENGFWVEPAGLIGNPAPLVAAGDYFTRRGQPYPITGTTYMSSVTHRSWMFEPTPLTWDQDFAAMRAAGVNVVRTGLWMGWKRAMTEAGAVDEGVIRALRAFLLSAAQHDLPVIMTLFAFLPETWGGTNPYLDPVAVRAQCAFATALARGVSDAPHLLWDLINEPSVASPKHLWSCRPTGDRAEAEAWRQWLTTQGLSDDEWRERWRLTPTDSLSLPRLEDFEDRHNWDDAKPLRCMDFVRFAQEVFARWAATIAVALRACNTPPQLITVGQDEAGCGTSPSPHFHGSAMDFTANHSWWQNDDLLWDVVVTKLPGKPHLMEETGIMFAETADGLPVRSPEFVAGLLERKLALAFAGGGAGVIQWLWNTCIYNYSDNEAGIGLLRADGGEKPELAAFRRIAHFMARNAARLTGRVPERAAVLIPHSNLFSVRETAQAATRRAVRTLEYRLGLPCHGVSEYAPEALGDATLIVLPAPRILREDGWQAVLARVRSGATLLLTGYAEADDAWRETARLGALGVPQQPAPLNHEEVLTLAWGAAPVTWRVCMPIQARVIPKFQKAVAPDGSDLTGSAIACGQGRILFCPLPIEHALAEEDTEAVYRLAAASAGLTCGKRAEFADGGPGLLVHPVAFADSALFILVNESNHAQTANLRGAALSSAGAWETPVTVPANGAVLAFVDPRTGRVLDASHQQRPT